MPAKTIIGLEVHLQLPTNSKLFCGCSTKAQEPNTSVCEVCLGFPGSKPMLNKKAVELAVKVALSLNCKINKDFFFSRKTYFYPDLAKNFQITQFEMPIGIEGRVVLGKDKIGITRVHLEEDPAALVHEDGLSQSNYSLVDYNRSGIPLVEIVTKPVLSSPAQAREFLNALLVALEYIEVYDDELVLKADANISLAGGERVEVKNILGFKSVEKALLFEEQRQVIAFEKKEKIERQTRGFDEKTLSTYLLRKKETEDDYGYIFDPDLPLICLDDAFIDSLQKSIPELFEQKVNRFVKKLGLSEYDACVIASSKHLSELFEQVAGKVKIEAAAKFFSREILGIINYNGLSIRKLSVSANEVANLLSLLERGLVSEKNAKEAMIKYLVEGISPTKYLESSGLLLDIRGSEVEKIVLQVLSENKPAVKDLALGETKALNFLVGLVMRKTKGKSNPKEVQKIIEEAVKKKLF